MTINFAEMLAVGGKSNSLGRVNDVIEFVLKDKSQLDELYACLFDKDAWVVMRAADGLEKICREHPDWFAPYIDKFLNELATSTQASVQWHLAQIYKQVNLNESQRLEVINWLKQLLSTKEVDWIVSANAMDTLAQFTRDGLFPVSDMTRLLQVQQTHKSPAVVKRATKLLADLSVK